MSMDKKSQTAIACPFYSGDETGCLGCSGGQRLRFDNNEEKKRYIKRWCSSVNHWAKCSIAVMLWERYDSGG